MAQEENKLAFLDDSLPWREALGVLVVFTLILLLCYWAEEKFDLLEGKISGMLIAVHPLEWKSLPAVILANFFHANEQHLWFNLITFWLLGMWALKKEGTRAITGMFYGIFFAGVAAWMFGFSIDFSEDDISIDFSKDTAHLGFSGVVYALAGILIVSSIRTGFWTSVLMCIAIFLVFGGTLHILPDDTPKEISWISHLGGLIGGMYSQIRNPVIALRILAEDDFVTPEEAEIIYERIPPVVDNDDEEKEEDESDDPDEKEEPEDDSELDPPLKFRDK